MEHKNDLELWHMFTIFAKKLIEVAQFNEMLLIHCCQYYHINETFEEYCKCPDIKRDKDFKSEKECYKCSFFKFKLKPTDRNIYNQEKLYLV